MISYLLAVDKENLIGADNKLPWHLPADLKYFKEITMGHTIIMGRKTYDSIGKPLSGRNNIVLTTDIHFQAPGCKVMHSVEEVLELDSPHVELFIIGGNAVFKAFEHEANRLYLTQIDHVFEGDTYFTMDYRGWKILSEKEGVVDEKNIYPHRFLILERPYTNK